MANSQLLLLSSRAQWSVVLEGTVASVILGLLTSMSWTEERYGNEAACVRLIGSRGWPRRSRTAEASHISRSAMKLGCARERGGWGRLSDDGRDSKPDRSEDPWGRWSTPPHGGAVIASTDPTLGGSTLKHEGRRQTDRMSVYAGSRLKLMNVSGRSRLIRQPSSRNGQN